jgi:methyltransferase of ATP-grasp peptide maturase system
VSVTSVDRQARLDAYVTGLVRDGHLRDPAWITAFAAVARHVFTPTLLLSTPDGYRAVSDTPGDREEWLERVYSDDSLVTEVQPHAAGYRLPSGQPVQVPTSSSTMPSLMARMLEALRVDTGMRVLEIGTGTGYNAALLSHRLGSAQVTSIDIALKLVEQARTRLERLGYTPTLVTGDGTAGVPGHGPYDRIIATAAVPDIPDAWIHQLAPGGKILANLRGELSGAYLCLLTCHGDEASGPLLDLGGHFMWLRPAADDPHRVHPPRRTDAPSADTVAIDDPATVPLEDDGFRFLLQAQLPGAQALYRGQDIDPATGQAAEAIVLTATDGSRAAAFTQPAAGRYRIVQSGPRRLWDTLTATVQLWRTLGEPTPTQFDVLAGPAGHTLCLDPGNGQYRCHWPLPLL